MRTTWRTCVRCGVGWRRSKHGCGHCPWPAALEAARRNGKEARIRHDLRLAAEPAPLQARDCGRLPGVSAPDAYALGVAYVIEGSQLGGAMLAKRFHLAAPLGGIASGPAPDRATAYTYLSGYGADTGVLWRRFLVFLDATVQTPAEIEAACRGAVDAFETLAAWLAAQGVLTVAGKPTVHAA